MLHSPVTIKPCAAFWDETARVILRSEILGGGRLPDPRDLSGIRVVVPTVAHVQLLRQALASRIGATFLPPRIVTMPSWLALQPPVRVAGDSERLMLLYAQLREQAWLKKLFSARRNTDLMPLARTLLTLSDELTQALFPLLREIPDAADARWQAALAQLAPQVRDLLSDETQMVWSIWKGLLDERDPLVARFHQMQRIAEQASEPLAWIAPAEPDAFEQAFLDTYGRRCEVLPVTLDWRARALDPALTAAWPELADEPEAAPAPAGTLCAPACLRLCEAGSLEDEAVRAAQTVVDWLSSGKRRIALVAQDRVVARRIRALLERAQVAVSDETGWKLSTTRAAAALTAWFESVSAGAETVALLDFLKSPFVFADVDAAGDRVMAIEIVLRRDNVTGGWDAIASALAGMPEEAALIDRLAVQAAAFAGQRRTLSQWVATTKAAIDALAMRAPLAADHAGAQVLALFEAVARDCARMDEQFSFSEWRVFVGLQFESVPFAPPDTDRRVVMLPLNGTHLRSFDAVLVVGADADHLPSKPVETLFFANAVRRELGLATCESRQRQQLRDLAELLLANDIVVASWQGHKDGEPNAPSPWLARLSMALERAGAAPVPRHEVCLQPVRLTHAPVVPPAPAAPGLIPAKLSASGYNSFVACPYQFFATRMLGLSALDELSDMPEKRDYGDWLHEILTEYHETIRDKDVPAAQRNDLMAAISERVFRRELARSAAALGYFARWKKTMAAYVDWANAREADGWRFEIGEQWFEKRLAFPGGEITLHGRIDRIDTHADGGRAVLDYKTRDVSSLRNRFRRIEDHQLAFYGLISDKPVSAAHYVALEVSRDKTGDAPAPHFPQWQSALSEHVVRSLQAISQGAALKPNGIETVCQYCDVRGLCRKGAW